MLTPEAIDALLEYEWPGNVRELRNVMEAAYILSGGGSITNDHLPSHLRQLPAGAPPPTLTLTRPPEPASMPAGRSAAKTLKEIEMEHILRVLNKHNGNKPAAAAELGIVLKTLYNKLNQWEEERSRTAG